MEKYLIKHPIVDFFKYIVVASTLSKHYKAKKKSKVYVWSRI